jgi:hypothetical protein
MELDDLKTNWQNAGDIYKTEADLQEMTRIVNHPSLKRVRTKLIVEIIGLTVLLLVYYDWFDGHEKSMYANLTLVTAVFLYILNDVVGYFSLSKPIMGVNLRLSIQNYLSRVTRLFILSTIASVLYSASVIIFFMSVVNLTREKKLILAGIGIIFFQMIFWSSRIWRRRINKLKEQVMQFNTED